MSKMFLFPVDVDIFSWNCTHVNGRPWHLQVFGFALFMTYLHSHVWEDYSMV